jgi:hypothetical protein
LARSQRKFHGYFSSRVTRLRNFRLLCDCFLYNRSSHTLFGFSFHGRGYVTDFDWKRLDYILGDHFINSSVLIEAMHVLLFAKSWCFPVFVVAFKQAIVSRQGLHIKKKCFSSTNFNRQWTKYFVSTNANFGLRKENKLHKLAIKTFTSTQ